MPLFFRYWGKARTKKKESEHLYHLLPYHCLDVAACGYQMVMRNVFGLANYLMKLGFPNKITAANWFAYFLACHDIGKYARGFQRLYPHNQPNLVPALTDRVYSSRHDSLGYWLWWEELCQKNDVFFSRQPKSQLDYYLLQWMTITTGHHGTPPDPAAKGRLAFADEDIEAAKDYLIALKSLFPFDCYPDFFYEKEAIIQLRQHSWNLAGLIVLADWLGSHQDFFPYQSVQMPLQTYWDETALPQAERAVQTIPLKSSIVPFKAINQLFPFIEKPTPLQQHALNVNIAGTGAQLFILEDVTGAGKTEAAMILAHRLLSLKKGEGLYIGLPTMATANAMYERLADAYHALFDSDSKPSLALAHGARRMSERFTQSVWTETNQDEQDYCDQERGAGAECNGWFADSNKKALLAEIGVGTLDQALMAIMPFRHHSLKLLGLNNKVLILDEVHAYDAYQNKLLESLLDYHASQGGSAIILTATLPFLQREKLLNAFNQSASGQTVQPNLDADYPWFTSLNNGQLTETKLDTRSEVKRQVNVQWLYQVDEGLALIKRAIKEGQCICWIRNSVDDAINVYKRLLVDSDVCNEDILLFHSRFAFCDRLAIENQALTRFGKNSTPEMRRGKVLISTQVIEQSLDIDLDLMISDIAPIDLLIQRAGRLQRHIRDANGKRKTNIDVNANKDDRPFPELYILAPEWCQDADKDWLGAELKNTGFVYEDHAKLWLTQSILRQRKKIKMPDDARLLIEFVYGEQQTVPSILQELGYDIEGKTLSKRAIARQNILTLAKGYNHSACQTGWSNEVNISTRLSETTVDLYLAYLDEHDELPQPYCPDNDFPWEKSRIQVRQSLWLKIKAKLLLLDDELLEKLRKKTHRPNAQVVLLTKDEPNGFYSDKTGLFMEKD